MSEVKFERENRYIVIKRSDLEKVPVGYWSSLIEPIGALQAHLPHRECLVIESDWPEYEPVWQMIERRVTGGDIPAAETMGYSVVGNRYMISLTQQEILEHSQSYAGCMFELVARSALDAQRLRADTAEAELAEKIRDEVNLKIIVEAAKNNQEELRESRDSFQRVGIQTMEKLSAAEQRIAKLRELLRLMTVEYACCLEAGYDRITFLGGECDSVSKMLADNVNYAKACAALYQKSEGESQ